MRCPGHMIITGATVRSRGRKWSIFTLFTIQEDSIDMKHDQNGRRMFYNSFMARDANE